MAKVALTEQYLEDIADALRAKSETSNTYTPAEMAPAILALPAGGGIIPTGTISITTNGTHNVYNYASADVQVSSTINNQNKTVSPSTSQQSITADSGYTGLGTVTVNAMPSGTAGTPEAYKMDVIDHTMTIGVGVVNTAGYIPGGTVIGSSISVSASELDSGTKSITQNGTGIDVVGYAAVDVSVSGGAVNNQNKTVTSSGTLQTVTYDSGYTGLGTVTINAAPAALINQQAVTGTPTITVDENGEISAIYYSSDTSVSPVTTAGWVNTSTTVPLYVTVSGTSQLPTQAAATITPTTSPQVAVAAGKYTTGAVTVAAMPTMTLPTAVSSTSSGTSKATLTLTGGTKYLNIPTGYNGTAQYYTLSVANGSATGPSSLSGTSATISTGTNTLTLTKTGVTTTPTVSAGYVSSATASTATVTLTANVTTQAASTYYPSTSDQTISASRYLTGAQTIKAVTTSNLIAGNIKKDVVVTVGDSDDADRIISVTGTYEGGSALTVDTATATLSSASTSISFTGLAGEPTSFAVVSAAELATGASPWKTAAVVFDGTNLHGQTIRNTSNSQVTYDGSSFSKTYSNGTLTITGSGTNFQANQYKLVYTYGGSDIGTADVQVGSGATSITFTGLEEEPSYFSCIFKSNFSTSSGYQRVIVIVYDGTSTYGMEMDSSAKASTAHWTYSYNNGSLTITSSGTNAGGYFHQPGYYQLTYAVEGSSGNYQTKSATYYATSSQQTASITADSGYDALKKVNITISPVTTTNLTASNIVSGVTIQVGDAVDSDRIASVTGNVVLQNYYTGSSAPSSSTGSNGDLYLQS